MIYVLVTVLMIIAFQLAAVVRALGRVIREQQGAKDIVSTYQGETVSLLQKIIRK